MAKAYLSRALFFLSAILAASAHAHHSVWTHFDVSRTIEIEGTLVDFKLRSPHSSLVVDGTAYVDGVRQGNEIERWEIESGSLPLLRRMGMDSDTLEPGERIRVVAWPNNKPGFKFVFSETFTTGDGRVFSSEQTTPLEAPPRENLSAAVGFARIEGRWQAPVLLSSEEGTPLPLNEAGQAAWNNYDPKLSPANTCETQSLPAVFNAPYLYDIRIDGEEVVLHHQIYDVRRTLQIGAEPALVDTSGLFGIASARVEDETLVVESRGYPPSAWGLAIAVTINGAGADIPSSELKTVTERYTVSEDGQTLFVEYTVDDPAYLTGSYTGRVDHARVPDDAPMYPYECDVESASMFSRDPGEAPLPVGNE